MTFLFLLLFGACAAQPSSSDGGVDADDASDVGLDAELDALVDGAVDAERDGGVELPEIELDLVAWVDEWVESLPGTGSEAFDIPTEDELEHFERAVQALLEEHPDFELALSEAELVAYDASGRMTGDWDHTVSYASIVFRETGA